MKITSSNQTLILAGERDAFGARSPSIVEKALRETELQRLTIVTSRPDSTLVFVQADYRSAADSGLSAAIPGDAARSALPSSAVAGVFPLPAAPTSPEHAQAVIAPQPRRSPSGLSRGVLLYASTQGILSDAPCAALLDVHA